MNSEREDSKPVSRPGAALRWLSGSLPGRYIRALSNSTRIVLCIVAGLVVAIFGLSAFSGPPMEVDATPPAVPVVARVIEPRALAPELHVFGRVENPNTTTLKAATLAYVSAVNVREGQRVQAGDVLLRLDDRDARLEVQRARAALTEARGELRRVLAQQKAEVTNAAHQGRLLELTVKKEERFRKLFSQGQIAATDYDTLEQQRLEVEMALNTQEMLLAGHEAQRATAEARVERADADHQQAALNLERLALIAPFDGTIIAVDAAVGARIDAGQNVITLFDLHSQQVRVSLPARDALALSEARASGEHIGAVARVADSWVELNLLDIGSQVRSGRAGTDVLFSVQGHRDLALGRAVDVRITLPAQEGLIEVPLQGVYADRLLYTVRDGVLQAIDIERVGVREDSDGKMRLLVRATGLDANAPVVVSSLSRATSGTRVSIIGADAQRPSGGLHEEASETAVAAR